MELYESQGESVRFFEPSGLPGPGRLGLGARVGQGRFGRRVRAATTPTLPAPDGS